LRPVLLTNRSSTGY